MTNKLYTIHEAAEAAEINPRVFLGVAYGLGIVPEVIGRQNALQAEQVTRVCEQYRAMRAEHGVDALKRGRPRKVLAAVEA